MGLFDSIKTVAGQFLGGLVSPVTGRTPTTFAGALGGVGGAIGAGIGTALLQRKLAEEFAPKVAEAQFPQFAPAAQVQGQLETAVPVSQQLERSIQPVGGPMAMFVGGPATPMLAGGVSGFLPALTGLAGQAVRGGVAVAGRVLRSPAGQVAAGAGLAGGAGALIEAAQMGGGGDLFRVSQMGRATPLSTVMAINPVSGNPTFWRHVGRPILFSGDLRVARTVDKVARRARRKR